MRLTPVVTAGCCFAFGCASRLSAQTITGRVYDSLAKAPLVGATVQLLSSTPGAIAPIEAITDNLGNYRLDGVPAGSYVLGFYHALLDSLGLEPPVKRISYGGHGRALRVDLGVPSSAGIAAAVCGMGADNKKESPAVLVGHLYDATSKQGVGGATVVAEWQRIALVDKKLEVSTPQMVARTVAGGGFAFCGIPRDDDVMVTAIRGSDTTGSVSVHVTAAGFSRRDLFIDSAAQGRLSGTVIDAGNHRPLVGAQVSFVGTTVAGTTDDRGAFRLSGAPGGTQTFLVRAVGFSPERRSVDLLADRPATADVQLTNLRVLLDTIKVTGQRLYSRDAAGFDRRRKTGFGRFFDSTDVERLHPFETTRLLQEINGIRLSGSGATLRILIGNPTPCEPTIFLNGIMIPDFSGGDLNGMVAPEDITGMEVYTSAGSSPAQYKGMSFTRNGRGCGSIVVWTKWHR